MPLNKQYLTSNIIYKARISLTTQQNYNLGKYSAEQKLKLKTLVYFLVQKNMNFTLSSNKKKHYKYNYKLARISLH